tara:strand:- start:2372 stop:3457 length:1086 start_codon:yes stop_codon:yes gene_type:complete
VRLESLSIQNFRSLSLFNISFNNDITVLCGQNNAGKTTLLESIFLSSNLRTFKSAPNIELINKNSDHFKISLNFTKKSLNNNIFIEKSLKSAKVSLNSKRISKYDISLAFPCYSLVFGFNNILLNDASYRRDFLDTGMFHVEHDSRRVYLAYEKTLKQRNFLLKSKHTDHYIWDSQLIELNNTLSSYRLSYFDNLNSEFSRIISELRTSIPEIYSDVSSLQLHYLKGWDGKDYGEYLHNNKDKEASIGYTVGGTHRSDFTVTSLGKPVKESGSMSTLVLACLIINLAKINVFHVKHGYRPILLIDDLFFGIDNKNLSTVVKLLVHSKGNIVLTAPNIYKEILEKISSDNNCLEVVSVGENN